jgi:hypothetical protein
MRFLPIAAMIVSVITSIAAIVFVHGSDSRKQDELDGMKRSLAVVEHDIEGMNLHFVALEAQQKILTDAIARAERDAKVFHCALGAALTPCSRSVAECVWYAERANSTRPCQPQAHAFCFSGSNSEWCSSTMDDCDRFRAAQILKDKRPGPCEEH